ncbi:hypothetical protein cyc_00987 [Cyclospora cayetanensis]|uniref:Uncharacterized protein n=1 Tax=Cyclospora cayetanensis TaxID=88456 RepID=A0A1D3D0P5_9EIME|nr:hypothetical protein cyc_00987 [Cyclospora cayetanensis]
MPYSHTKRGSSSLEEGALTPPPSMQQPSSHSQHQFPLPFQQQFPLPFQQQFPSPFQQQCLQKMGRENAAKGSSFLQGWGVSTLALLPAVIGQGSLGATIAIELREGSLVFVEEEGLGRASDVAITAEEAAGGTRIDPNELKKIEHVLPTFTRSDGSGILRLLSACDGQFAFVFQGPLQHRFGVKEWARYMITSAYPGAQVKFITEHYADTDDRPGSLKGFIPDEEIAEYRKAFRWRQARLYAHEEGQPIPGGHQQSPQPIP